MDPEIAAAFAHAADLAAADAVVPERGDALALRDLGDRGVEAMFLRIPPAKDVSTRTFSAPSFDGHEIECRWYAREDAISGPAVVYAHGGGMICGTLDNYEPLVRYYVQTTAVPFLSVGYRLAPEVLGVVPAEDAYAGLRWLAANAVRLGTEPSRIALMGDSGGGGVAAGAAVLARDRRLPLARQILVYPMLDDRNVNPDPDLAETAAWSYDNNYTAWHALLQDDLGTPDVSPVAAPARLADFSGLAPCYLEVGELDIFRDEDIEYAERLLRAGVSCELHVHPGAPHAFEWINPDSAVAKRALADRVRVITSL
jgi:acetyl esterase/lipase